MTKMRIISVQMPQNLINAMDQLVKRGIYPNRSEIIRAALRDFLKRELQMDFNDEELPEYIIR
ncbi:ribbon-helix-helix domain-containing protein [Thermococcus sp.]|uniref:ribbon-helix-helix domain-containing protein n=1 Tax=Thermococcus sp. TaxID=35749 RepID=UPI00261D3A70|nr:ribbon-helix-helix domain-containing protein [Thermococcus sp.]